MIVRASPSGRVVIPAVLTEALGWLAGTGNNLALVILPAGHTPGLYMISHSYTWRVADNTANDMSVGLTWRSDGVAQSALPVPLTYGSSGATRIASSTAQRLQLSPASVNQNFPRPPIVLLSDGSAPIVLTANYSTTLASPGIDFYVSVLLVG